MGASVADSCAESALNNAIALLDAPTAAKAEPLAGEFLEYLDAMDYNKYFDAMPSRVVSAVFANATGLCLLLHFRIAGKAE
jgi:hypothetical protein